jgi:parallel beta-helix repeat protein
LFQECIGTYIAGNEISGNSVDIGRECINIHGARESIVENNYIHDCPYATAIQMIEGALPAVEFSNIVRGNVCLRVGAGVRVKGGCIVTGNILQATLGPAATVGHHCHFIGNRIIEGIEAGIALFSNDDTVEDVIIANNAINNIHIAGGTACDGIVGVINNGFVPQSITVSNNIILNSPTATSPFNGIRLQHVGSNITVDNNQIYGADYGLYVSTEQNNTMERLRATNNTITLKTNGTGAYFGAESAVNGNLRHVVVSGNIAAKAYPAGAGTFGVRIEGDPDRVILTSNDTSDTDTPFISIGAGPTNMVTANNNGF